MECCKRGSFHYSSTPSLHYSRHRSSKTQPAFALLKKRAKRREVIPPCLQCDRINIVPPERVRKFCFTSADKLAKERTRSAISGIDLQLLSGFGILQRDDADIRQYPFSFVFNVDGYEIVPPSAHSEGLRKIRCLKIRDEKDDRAPCHNFVEVIKRQRRFRAASLRLEKQNLANESQRVRSAFFRRDKKFHAIGEEDEPDFVVVPDCTEGEQACNFCRQFPLGLCRAAKIPRRTHVDDQHHRKLSLFREFFHKRVAHPRRNIPVDGANLVAGLIFPDVLKIHAAAFEDAMVVAGECSLDQAAGLDLECPDFFENLGCVHAVRDQ